MGGGLTGESRRTQKVFPTSCDLWYSGFEHGMWLPAPLASSICSVRNCTTDSRCRGESRLVQTTTWTTPRRSEGRRFPRHVTASGCGQECPRQHSDHWGDRWLRPVLPPLFAMRWRVAASHILPLFFTWPEKPSVVQLVWQQTAWSAPTLGNHLAKVGGPEIHSSLSSLPRGDGPSLLHV